MQVDEIVNISNPLKNRYQKAAVGLKRCLKLSLTDGVQRIIAMEYRPIQALEALAPAGLKVVFLWLSYLLQNDGFQPFSLHCAYFALQTQTKIILLTSRLLYVTCIYAMGFLCWSPNVLKS